MENIIISVLNNKGGCGKTTTVVTLAHIIGKDKKLRVLAIDNDTQGNAGDILLKGVNYDNNLYNLIIENAPIPTCIYRTAEYKNVWCLPNDPEYMAAYEVDLSKDYKRYRAALQEYVRQHFDLVLIDNPPNLGTFTLQALGMSDACIVPTEAGSRFSTQGLINAMKFIEEIRTSDNTEFSNPELRFLKLLITKVDKRTNASNAIVEHITEMFPPEQRFETVVPVSAPIQQAEMYGETVLKFRSGAPGTTAYRKVADELVTALEV